MCCLVVLYNGFIDVVRQTDEVRTTKNKSISVDSSQIVQRTWVHAQVQLIAITLYVDPIHARLYGSACGCSVSFLFLYVVVLH